VVARSLLGQGPLLAPTQYVVLSDDAAEARAPRGATSPVLQAPLATRRLAAELGYGEDEFADAAATAWSTS